MQRVDSESSTPENQELVASDVICYPLMDSNGTAIETGSLLKNTLWVF